MMSKAAVLHGIHQPWTIEEIEIGAPRAGEVLVEWKSAGLCHSDDHLVTGDMVPPPEVLAALDGDFFPIIGGHEGSGVVAEIGPEVHSVAVGDHIAASFLPSCGRCRYCTTGRQNLCDSSAGTFMGGMITDGTHRHSLNGRSVGLMSKIGTFSQHSCVAESSVIKVDSDLSFDAVALVSCGVATGWGSATARAEVKPGETVVVVGVGGIGINAVQGAVMAGAMNVVAVDPVSMKLEVAKSLGATHSAASMAEALPLVREITGGYLAEKVIMTPSVMYGELLGEGLSLVGKGGTLVCTAVAPMAQATASINLFELSMWNKEVKGTIFGSLSPRSAVPMLLQMYRAGALKLDELITRRYSLGEINEGYAALKRGELIRGILDCTRI
jgi:S-(hydroxymethyl)glutathione dehydrogenase/alcohol dehydrogenase